LQKVTGQKFEIVELAGKIIELRNQHTSNMLVALTTAEIAGKFIALKELIGEPA